MASNLSYHVQFCNYSERNIFWAFNPNIYTVYMSDWTPTAIQADMQMCLPNNWEMPIGVLTYTKKKQCFRCYSISWKLPLSLSDWVGQWVMLSAWRYVAITSTKPASLFLHQLQKVSTRCTLVLVQTLFRKHTRHGILVCLAPNISVHSSVHITRLVAYNRLVAQYALVCKQSHFSHRHSAHCAY